VLGLEPGWLNSDFSTLVCFMIHYSRFVLASHLSPNCLSLTPLTIWEFVLALAPSLLSETTGVLTAKYEDDVDSVTSMRLDGTISQKVVLFTFLTSRLECMWYLESKSTSTSLQRNLVLCGYCEVGDTTPSLVTNSINSFHHP
jgi:hypothetical protein